MKRVLIYCRVSTDRQALKGDSITDQLQSLRKWAAENDCVILDEYIDAGFSAGKEFTTRPQFCRMIADAERLRPDFIAFTRLDRFTRLPRDYYNVIHEFDKHNLRWISIDQNFDATTPEGRAMIGNALVWGQLERDTTSRRIKLHNIQKRARGELCSGNLPRGYKIENKRPVKDPVYAPAVEAFFDTYLSGAGIIASMHAAQALGLSFSSVTTAAYMLRNSRSYAGIIQGVPCEPYITEEQCQFILDTRKTRTKPSGHTYLFKGMIRCGCCGGNFGAHRSFYTIRGTGERRATVYYTCSNHDNHRFDCTSSVHIRECVVEEFLINEIDSYMSHQYDILPAAPAVPDNSARIRSLQAKRERLLDAFIDGIIEKEVFTDKVNKIDKEIEELSAVVVPEVKEIKLPDNWRDIYNSLSIDGKRGFWYKTVSEITVNPDKTMHFSFC